MQRYRVHKFGYWRICIPHDRYRACGQDVLWDDIPSWREAMAIVNQINLITWAANYDKKYREGRCFW